MAKEISQRQLRFSQEVQRILSSIFHQRRYAIFDREDIDVTVWKVESSSDLKVCRIFIMLLGGGSKNVSQGELKLLLKKKSGKIRHFLSQSLYASFVPKLMFVFDASFENLCSVQRLLDQNLKSLVEKNQWMDG